MIAYRKTVWAATTFSLLYATLRYNVFKGVPWSDWPVYIVNKALALSSLLLVVAWILRARRDADPSGPRLLSAARTLMFAHAGLSLAILSPGYFPGFFADGRLTGQAGVSVLLGMMAASWLGLASRTTHPSPSQVRSLGAIAMATGIHAMLNGYASWLAPATWPGHMVPITLISFAAGVVAVAAALWRPVSI